MDQNTCKYKSLFDFDEDAHKPYQYLLHPMYELLPDEDNEKFLYLGKFIKKIIDEMECKLEGLMERALEDLNAAYRQGYRAAIAEMESKALDEEV